MIELTNENFTKVIKGYEKLLVNFHSPLCPFSKRLMPEFKEASEKFSIGKVDVSKNDKLKQYFDIIATPDYRWIVKGESVELPIFEQFGAGVDSNYQIDSDYIKEWLSS